MLYPALLPLIRTPLLPVVDWTDAHRPIEMDSSVSCERRNLVSARVPSHFNCPVPFHGVATYTSACVGPLRWRCNFCVDVFTTRAMNLLIIKLGIPRLAEQLSTKDTLPPWEHQITWLQTVQRDAATSCRTRATWRQIQRPAKETAQNHSQADRRLF